MCTAAGKECVGFTLYMTSATSEVPREACSRAWSFVRVDGAHIRHPQCTPNVLLCAKCDALCRETFGFAPQACFRTDCSSKPSLPGSTTRCYEKWKATPDPPICDGPAATVIIPGPSLTEGKHPPLSCIPCRAHAPVRCGCSSQVPISNFRACVPQARYHRSLCEHSACLVVCCQLMIARLPGDEPVATAAGV